MAKVNTFKLKVVEAGGRVLNSTQSRYVARTQVAYAFEDIDTSIGKYCTVVLSRETEGKGIQEMLGVNETLSKVEAFMAAAGAEIIDVTILSIDSATNLDIDGMLVTDRIHTLVASGTGSQIYYNQGKGYTYKQFLISESPASLGLSGSSSA